MSDFSSIYSHGYVRVAACSPEVVVADPRRNAQAIIDAARVVSAQGAVLAVFPELSLTGYSAEDLFLQDALLRATLEALETVRAASVSFDAALIVGAPLHWRNRLYNCAVVLHHGNVLGVVPKSYIPNYREFYEKRHFASGAGLREAVIELPGVRTDAPWSTGLSEEERAELAQTEEAWAYTLGRDTVPFGPDLIFSASDIPGFDFHVEICEDMWVPIPPSARAALAGAQVLVNLSGSPVTVGREDDRDLLIRGASARCAAAYIYAANGEWESSTDLAWDGQTVIYECGEKIAAGQRFSAGHSATLGDIDLDRIRQERQRNGSFNDNALAQGTERDAYSNPGTDSFRTIHFTAGIPDMSALSAADQRLHREVVRFPFMGGSERNPDRDCFEAFSIQVYALITRLRATGSAKVIIGVSGGLDSTHALLVACRAMDLLERPRADILAYTLPGFATSQHTKNNAYALCEALGVPLKEIDIRPAARQMLADMGHPFAGGEPVYDLTFENVQAGLRTDYLFRLAGFHGGIVLGTGDLSELALGWCTFGVGDHMSHYNVNAGMPKTFMQHVLRWMARQDFLAGAGAQALTDILHTEISPELVPADAGGALQSTQEKIGPYELQDFTLYFALRYGFLPSKIAFLAREAWGDSSRGFWPEGIEVNARHAYSLAEIKKWMELFYRRFFSQQFKRSTLPNGPKILSGGSLSPRGDWRMPSDATSRVWLADLENIPSTPTEDA